MSEFEVSKLVADYHDGMGLIKLSTKYSLGKSVVRKHLVDAGVTLRGKGRPKGSVNTPKVPVTPTPASITEIDPFVTSTTPPEDFRGLID